MARLACEFMGNRRPTYRVNEGFFPVGIEVEFERVTDHRSLTYWQTVRDGSLRNNGMEFIFRSPMDSREDVLAAVEELMENAIDFSYVRSIRTSTHVHVNMQDRTMDDLRSIMLAYMIAEPALYAYAGHHRDINPYCIPWYTNPDNAVLLARAARDLEQPGMVRRARNRFNRANKYAGLFVGPLTTFGSIEFRQLPAPNNVQHLMEWVDMVQRVVSYGVNNNVVEQVQAMTPHELGDRMGFPVPEERDLEAGINAVLPWLTPDAPVPLTRWIMVDTQAPITQPSQREHEPARWPGSTAGTIPRGPVRRRISLEEAFREDEDDYDEPADPDEYDIPEEITDEERMVNAQQRIDAMREQGMMWDNPFAAVTPNDTLTATDMAQVAEAVNRLRRGRQG